MFLSACNYPTGVRKSPAGDRVTFNVSPTCVIEAAANLQGEVSKARTVIFSQPSSEPPEFCPQPPRSPGAAGSEPLRSSTGRDGDRGQAATATEDIVFDAGHTIWDDKVCYLLTVQI